MAEQITSRVFYGGTSVGDRHWITGQAYPPSEYGHFNKPEVREFSVDAVAVFGDAAPGDTSGRVNAHYSVHLMNPPEGESDGFDVDLSSGGDQYSRLVKEVEARHLGRTGLNILVY